MNMYIYLASTNQKSLFVCSKSVSAFSPTTSSCCSYIFLFLLLLYCHYVVPTSIYTNLLLSAHEGARLAQLLHVLANLDVSLKVLGHASVQAQGFLLVHITFGVRTVDALCVTLFNKRVEHASNHVQFSLCGLDFLLRSNLGCATESEHRAFSLLYRELYSCHFAKFSCQSQVHGSFSRPTY